jgi:predicted O-methyltransferase YrrM
MKFDQVADAVRGVPFMTLAQGRAIYDHVIKTRPEQVLELGTAHGVSAAYIAAAMDENGSGHLTTLDRTSAGYEPNPDEVLGRAGLQSRVSVIVRDDSSYDWYLKEQVQSRSNDAGFCEPLYDLCYLDGAHEWVIDGLAVVLVEKLLRADGWLILDDLTWLPTQSSADALGYSEAERSEPHMKAIFELIIKQSPNFTQFRLEPDLDWAWACKKPGQPARLTIDTNRSLRGVALLRLRDSIRSRR